MQGITLGEPQAQHLPARLHVAELLSSRYAGSGRPLSWDERVEGADVVRTLGGEVVLLRSSAMQSPPKPGWVLLITGGSMDAGYTWTLYGIPPHS